MASAFAPASKDAGTGANLETSQPPAPSAFKAITKEKQISVRFESICAWVPNLVITSTKDAEGNVLPAKDKQVLFNVSGEVLPGEVLALMGPSGSGKTSLLSILGGRSTAETTGAITFNGKPVDKAIKRKLGFVTQDDKLFGELTVYETLYFAALLRLPRTLSREAKLARVEMVIDALGLAKCRDTIIGGGFLRGVSGGERKRVAVGESLLINPSVIFLDEPTSGLDATTALKLMQTLRALASGGRTIITSIHQPSGRLYQQVDKLTLLADGRTMFYGDARVVAAWFEMQHQPCPYGVNIADHILDLANGNPPGEEDLVKGKAVVEELLDAFEQRTVGMRAEGVQASDLPADLVAALSYTASGTLASPQGSLTALQHSSVSPQHDAHSVRNSAVPSSNSGRAAAGHLGGIAIANGDGGRVQSSSVGAAAAGPGMLLCDPNPDSAAAAPYSSGSGGDNGALTAAERRPWWPRVRKKGGKDGRRDGGEAHAESVGAGRGQGKGGNGGDELRNLDPALHPAPKAVVDAGGDKWGAPFLQQVSLLWLRSLKTRRFSTLSSQKIFEHVAIALLSGCYWWQMGQGDQSTREVRDIGGLLFYIVVFMSFVNLFQALFTFPGEFQMLVKERQSGMYRLSAYYIARTTSELPVDCVLPTLFLWILYFMTGLRLEAGAFFASTFSLVLVVLVAQSYGLLIGAMVTNTETAFVVTNVLMHILMLVGGFYVQGLPVWIAWLKYVSFITWGWNLMLKIEYRHRGFDCSRIADLSAERRAAGKCQVQDTGVFGINVNESVVKEVCILLLMLIVLRIAVLEALRYKTTFKKKADRKATPEPVVSDKTAA